MKKIIIGSDHGGFERKELVKKILQEINIDFIDVGTFDGETPVDYPDIAQKVAEEISKARFSEGILLCGTGIGISIAANKFPSVRAALCYSREASRLSRAHNDANILVLPGRLPLQDELGEIVRIWFETQFEEGRHLRRIKKIKTIERQIDLNN
jgi:ribose 5-phosphate isomerase B